MYEMLLGICYFPGMNSRCQECCRSCQANGCGGERVPATAPEAPGRPWSVLQVKTLELSADRSGQYHGVLVCTDVFRKWVEVKPLWRNDAASVAGALTSICCSWGPPEKIRLGKGTEFQNTLVRALLTQFGVPVETGAVRHPELQGGVDSMNQTLITLMREVLDQASDWKKELDLLLFNHRTRPHSTTKVSPMHAMCAWKPRSLVVEACPETLVPSEWVENLNGPAAHVHDIVEIELSAYSPPQPPSSTQSPYIPDEVVLFRRPRLQQRLLPGTPPPH